MSPAPQTDHTGDRPACWGGVFAMSLCVFALIASEFMPVSLLTPIASDFHVSEGQVGQAITASGALAVLTSLFISSIAGGLDRKTLLLILTVLMAASGTLVAVAPGYGSFMIGRMLIGVVIGGFWSLSGAVAMRLVPGAEVPKALAIFNGGNALATVIAPPAGSFLGAIVGWRGAFFSLVPIAVIVFFWQWISLPSMSAPNRSKTRHGLAVLRNPIVATGMASIGLFFMGQFTLFTYVRPFLERTTRVDVSTLSFILLGIGISGFLGTCVIGFFVRNRLYRTLIVIPALMAGIALTLTASGHDLALTAVMLGSWGLIATAAPVGWWTWLARALPQDAEAGGGLMVAVVQLAITLGAMTGGVLFDFGGYRTTFSASAILLVLSAVFASWTARRDRDDARPAA
ncbi:MFS transporter [Swaminathania salitolerans]|uniref:MFS transporter n=1 Tax=Swaminathania salitolerans TaxID=182838 RepID=A0A511BRG5_9PROT|nr:MFS transporter [Swaminathania salitolerans]GBQ11987.1 arabinose efflux permease [Swaminathania salitolerans LMG 21291]GEL02692.1 MFS transporter [Swaminathania salitolerans]